jgi:2-polyprenyl-3-methyl-5-hydroxy-6-metoxy-1,4-benzoquinol methylase
MPNSFQQVEEPGSHILSFTGERYTPETLGNIYLEHMHRYLLVSDLVAGKDVLDIASGEGFGSYAMSRFARSVTGVDIDLTSVEHALRRYKKPNLDFRSGSCSDIPLDNNSVDVVVSFETIEHHDQHDQMMQEVSRVLRPGGIFIISSPEKHEYTDVPGTRNPFHIKELYRDEFQALMRAHFRNVAFYGQRVVFGSAIFLEGAPSHMKTTDARKLEESDGLARPIYLIAIASDAELPKLPASGLFEENVLNSEVVGVELQHLNAEREQFRQSAEHFQALSDARQSAIEALEARHHRSLWKRLKKWLRP